MAGSSTALVVTERPARFGKQLVSHLSRHHGGDWSDSDGHGWIQLSAGRVDVSASDDALALSISTDDGDLDQLEDVVGRHLVRFGNRDELRVEWHRGDGEPGSVQATEPVAEEDGPASAE